MAASWLSLVDVDFSLLHFIINSGRLLLGEEVMGQVFLGVLILPGARGGVVVKVLCYKPAGRGFDSRWCHWNFSVTYYCRSHYGPGVDSASNRNEYQVYFLGVKAAGA
jgi:hypothetical protein